MRNLKKILALVLALVMSLSLVTTAGAFSDDGDINANYQDAIDVLSGLDVFKGYSDGSFQPKGSITRAEVAAIIYRIDTGDVTDTQASIYSTWGKFKDVADGAWYAGYVNYCANAEYIKGRGNGIFDPQATVTGYEALAMILRAVGYDKNGEFTGSNWQVRTASIGRERGILKNVTEGLLGQAASREMVAEILFRSIVIPKVEFSANTLSYKLKGVRDTLGYEHFKLEEITGVVEANEKASLNATVPLIEGKVYMNVDGKGYTLNDENDDASGFDALGESYHAYITDADKSSTRVLKMSKSDDSKSWETWEDKEIGNPGDNKKFQETTGFLGSNNVVRLVNYGANATSGKATSDWRIRYVIERAARIIAVDANGVVTMERADWIALSQMIGQQIGKYDEETKVLTLSADYSWNDDHTILIYDRVIKPGDEITAADDTNIRYIFANADKYTQNVGEYIKGEVYVGTSSLKDVSDSMSYNEFVAQYINGGTTNGLLTFSKNDRGNYLKVIDNNNDGYADYALKNVYTMAQVVRAKDGEYGLDTEKKGLTDGDSCNYLDNEKVKTEDGTLALGDIVYYFMADGQGWAYKSESATVKVNTVNRVDRKITTDDGTEYLESDVHGSHVDSKDYTSGVTNMNGYSTYTVYFDGAKNIALFEDANSGDFKLIIDGWYNQTKNGIEYAVWTYNDETGRQEVRDVTRNASLFIDNSDPTVVQNNNWNALKELGGTIGALNAGNGTTVKTTVATLTSDGVLQPADYYRVTGSKTNDRYVAMIAVAGDVVPNSSALYKGTAYITGIDASAAYNDTASATNAVEIRALASTVYYVVYPDRGSESGYSVERYVGYANVPKIDGNDVEDVYAVGTLRDRTSTLGTDNYYTANVIVVEMKNDRKFGEQVFIYNMPEAGSSVAIETVDVIRENGEKDTIKVDFEASGVRGYHQALEVNSLNWTNWGPGLYYLYTTNTDGLYRVSKMQGTDIAVNNYAVGYVSTSGGTVRDDYVELYKLDNQYVAYDRDQWTINSNNVYKMKWNDRGLVADFAQYMADEGNISKFLDERQPGTSNSDHFWGDPDNCGTNDWNWNRVLVHYDGGVAKYVVSFVGTDRTDSLAKQVWRNSLPARTVWTGTKNRDNAVRYAQFMLDSRNKDELRSYEFALYTDTVLKDMALAVYNNAKLVRDETSANLIAQLVEAALKMNGANSTTADGIATSWGVKDALKYAKQYANAAAATNALSYIENDLKVVIDGVGGEQPGPAVPVSVEEDTRGAYTYKGTVYNTVVELDSTATSYDKETGTLSVKVSKVGLYDAAGNEMPAEALKAELTVSAFWVKNADGTINASSVKLESSDKITWTGNAAGRDNIVLVAIVNPELIDDPNAGNVGGGDEDDPGQVTPPSSDPGDNDGDTTITNPDGDEIVAGPGAKPGDVSGDAADELDKILGGTGRRARVLAGQTKGAYFVLSADYTVGYVNSVNAGIKNKNFITAAQLELVTGKEVTLNEGETIYAVTFQVDYAAFEGDGTTAKITLSTKFTGEDPLAADRKTATDIVNGYKSEAVDTLDADAKANVETAKAAALKAIEDATDVDEINKAVDDYKAVVDEATKDVEPPVDPGAIKIEAADENMRVGGSGSPFASDIQSGIEAKPGSENNAWVVTGAAKYAAYTDAFGSDKGYQVALKIGVKGVKASKLEVSTTTGQDYTGVDKINWKQINDGDVDGKFEDGTEYVILTRRLSENADKNITYVKNTVNGDKYVIDYSQVSQGDPDARFTVSAVGETEAVKEETTDYEVTGGELQALTVTEDPDDNSKWVVTGNAFYMDSFSKYATGAKGFFIALKVSYTGATAADMSCGIGEAGKADGTSKSPVGKKSEDEGLIVAQINGEKGKAEIAVKVLGKTLRIDVSGVKIGSEEKRLVVDGFDETKTVKEVAVESLQKDVHAELQPDGKTFKVTGELYWNTWSQDYGSNGGRNKWYTRSGYWMVLDVDAVASKANKWNEFRLIGSDVDNPTAESGDVFPAVDTDGDEGLEGAVIWYVNGGTNHDINATPKLKENSPRISYNGVVYTFDLSELKLIAPVQLRAATQKELNDSDDVWANVDLDRVCNITDVKTDWATNTIYVEGEAYYYAKMPSFEDDTRVNGYYVVLAEEGKAGDKHLTINRTDGGTAHDWNGTESDQAACVWGLRDLKDGVMNTTVSGFDTKWTLDFSRVTLTEKFDVKSNNSAATDLSAVTSSGVNAATLNKTTTTVQGSKVVVTGEAYKIDDASKMAAWGVADEKTGYYIVVDFKYHKDNPFAAFGSSEGTKMGKKFPTNAWEEDGVTLTTIVRIADVDGNRVGEMEVGRCTDSSTDNKVVFVPGAGRWQFDTSGVDLVDGPN